MFSIFKMPSVLSWQFSDCFLWHPILVPQSFLKVSFCFLFIHVWWLFLWITRNIPQHVVKVFRDWTPVLPSFILYHPQMHTVALPRCVAAQLQAFVNPKPGGSSAPALSLFLISDLSLQGCIMWSCNYCVCVLCIPQLNWERLYTVCNSCSSPYVHTRKLHIKSLLCG